MADQTSTGLPDQYAQIDALYQHFLGRMPDQPGLSYYQNDMNKNGASLDAVQQSIMMSPEYQRLHPQPSQMFSSMQPRTDSQNAWLQQARQATQNINAMPLVLDPSKLTSDRAQNQQTMYPSLNQPGGVTPVMAGGKNIGPSLASMLGTTDTSGLSNQGNLQGLLDYIKQMYGADKSTQAQSMIQSGSSAGANANNPYAQFGGQATADAQAQAIAESVRQKLAQQYADANPNSG